MFACGYVGVGVVFVGYGAFVEDYEAVGVGVGEEGGEVEGRGGVLRLEGEGVEGLGVAFEG